MVDKYCCASEFVTALNEKEAADLLTIRLKHRMI